ncbi:MAG: HAD family hydrolase [Acidimicrobiia bacterium]|nr:HAD family hydrolase [Acidimicrobiia bacterium]
MKTPSRPVTIGIDFDDTLWHTTPHFERGREILANLFEHTDAAESAADLVDSIEERRIRLYGYGYASFVLAGIEALLATGGRAGQLADIEPLFVWARETTEAPVELLDGVEETIPLLAADYRLIGITRGSIPTQIDLFLRSGLGGYFGEVEVLGRKTVGRYESILRRHRIEADRFVMVGDSLAADIEPALAAGGLAVHIPYGDGWVGEPDLAAGAGPVIESSDRWTRIASFVDLPGAIEGLVSSGG